MIVPQRVHRDRQVFRRGKEQSLTIQINCCVNTTSNKKTEPRQCHFYLLHSVSCVRTRTSPSNATINTLTMLTASQSQQGSQVKIRKATRYANVKWQMENGKFYLVDAFLCMLTQPFLPTAATKQLRSKQDTGKYTYRSHIQMYLCINRNQAKPIGYRICFWVC